MKHSLYKCALIFLIQKTSSNNNAHPGPPLILPTIKYVQLPDPGEDHAQPPPPNAPRPLPPADGSAATLKSAGDTRVSSGFQVLLPTDPCGVVTSTRGPAEQQAWLLTPGSPHLARLDHLLQGLQPLHASVLHGHGQEDCSVSSFLRHKCHQVLCKDVDEGLVKGWRNDNFNRQDSTLFLKPSFSVPQEPRLASRTTIKSPSEEFDVTVTQSSAGLGHSGQEHTAKEASLDSSSHAFWLVSLPATSNLGGLKTDKSAQGSSVKLHGAFQTGPRQPLVTVTYHDRVKLRGRPTSHNRYLHLSAGQNAGGQAEALTPTRAPEHVVTCRGRGACLPDTPSLY